MHDDKQYCYSYGLRYTTLKGGAYITLKIYYLSEFINFSQLPFIRRL